MFREVLQGIQSACPILGISDLLGVNVHVLSGVQAHWG